jgi:hypothetical protein
MIEGIEKIHTKNAVSAASKMDSVELRFNIELLRRLQKYQNKAQVKIKMAVLC